MRTLRSRVKVVFPQFSFSFSREKKNDEIEMDSIKRICNMRNFYNIGSCSLAHNPSLQCQILWIRIYIFYFCNSWNLRCRRKWDVHVLPELLKQKTKFHVWRVYLKFMCKLSNFADINLTGTINWEG